MTPYWIILAWVTMEGLEETGRTVMRDGYARPEFKAAPEAKAVTWKYGCTNTPEDMEKAKAFAATLGYTVIGYDKAEEEPLIAARCEILRRFDRKEVKAVE